MNTAYWPPGLPLPQMGSEFNTQEGRLVTEGDIALRERVTDPNHLQIVSVSWQFTEQQYQAFKAWHFHILKDGAAWFSIDWDDRDGLARFTDTYSTQQSSQFRSVSASVEIDYAIDAAR